MAEHEVTAADMEAAGERIAAREGVTVEEVRERVRRADAAERSRRSAQRRERSAANATKRECALAGCDRTFVPRNARHAYCSTPHRAAAFRARNGAPS